jgi:catechol 2,3-dioxygenase-like lactoylglutathione lyase family enzyme
VAIFTHVLVGTNDLDKATKFYDATLAPLGVKRLGPLGENAFMYGVDGPEFAVTRPRDGQAACHANGGTIGFKATTRAAVHAFHEAGLANGGSDEGAPGPRPFSPTAYGAYLRDPDGNKICTYCFAEE